MMKAMDFGYFKGIPVTSELLVRSGSFSDMAVNSRSLPELALRMTQTTGKQDTPSEENGEIENQQEKKLPFPRSIIFILANEICERFCFYGLRAVLSLYLKDKLGYTESFATSIFHGFTFVLYFTCIFGAFVSDGFLGKFYTILILSFVYCIGVTILTLGSIATLNLPAIAMTMIGLLLIGFGAGGIKPCVSAFAGNQFKLPEQAKQLTIFFSLFYFVINVGSLLSTVITPIFREDIQCFGEKDCFPLAFGFPAILMLISVIIFICGYPLYKMVKPIENIFARVFACIWTAISTRYRERKTISKQHWLDYAEEKCGKKLVMEVKILLKILLLYLPLPLFWGLFDQQGSRWTFMATRMDGNIGLFEIKPDQMLLINAGMILVFIPLYEVLFYPILSKCGISRPLQRMTFGGILAGVSFVIAALVEILLLVPNDAVIPKDNEAQLRIINGAGCPADFTTNLFEHEKFSLSNLESFEEKHVFVPSNYTYTFNGCGNEIEGTFNLNPASSKLYYLTKNEIDKVVVKDFDDNPKPSVDSVPILRVLVVNSKKTEYSLEDGHQNIRWRQSEHGNNRLNLTSGTYQIIDGNIKTGQIITLKKGGVYNLMLSGDDTKADLTVVSPPYSVNMLWLVPQYVVITLGEVAFSVTGLEFSFSQAPMNMKSVLQACWLLTVAFGNLIVVIVAAFGKMEQQWHEFLFFASLMFLSMGIFAWLSYRYEPISLEDLKKAEDEKIVSSKMLTKLSLTKSTM